MRRSQQARAAIVIAQPLLHERGHPRPFFALRRSIAGTVSGHGFRPWVPRARGVSHPYSLPVDVGRSEAGASAALVGARRTPSISKRTRLPCVWSSTSVGDTVPWDSQLVEFSGFLGMPSIGAVAQRRVRFILTRNYGTDPIAVP